MVAATNATLTLAGNWSNALGTLSSDNSNLFLRGTFTTAGLGAFTRTNGGTVRLEGALNNTSSTLNINSSTGSWQVVNGQITGGAIDYSDGEQLLFLANENNRLTDVTLLDELQLIESSYVELYGSTTFPTARLIVTIGGAGVQPQLAVAPGYVLPGNVYFAGIHPNNRTLRVDGVGTMTIPAGVSVETTPDFGGSAFVGSTNQTVINQGTIRSGTANRTLTIQPQALQNFGTIQAENSASMVVNSGAFENQGALTATGAAVLTVRPTVFSNFLDLTSLGNNRFGVTLQGGTYEVDGGTLRLFQGTNTAHSFVVQKLNAELIFVGANPRVYGNTTNTDSAIAEVSEIGAGGTLRLRDGAFYGPPGELLVRGTVEVDATSQFGLAPSAPITNDGLESHFAADGNDSNSAAGAGTITATRVGATFAPGVEGQGYSFDGQNDYVTIPADPSLNNANLTVSAWYKLDQLLTGPRLILSKTIGSGTLNSYAVWLDGDFLRFGIGNAGGLDFQSAAITRQVGKWNHVAMAFSDNNDLVQLFHNGSLLHSFSTTRSISYDNGRPHVIGADIENGNPAFFFPGVIDEVRYYDRALTATEIFNIAANSPGLTTRVRQVDGTVQIDGALASFRDYRLEGGTLFGSGLLPANLEQTGGLLAPGNSPGCLEIDGNYNLEAAGTLQIEIDGPTVCTQYDQLQVDGNVTLAGTLNVVLNPTYSPTIGQKFLILENDLTDAISGQFLYDGNALRERQVFLVNGNQLFRISYIAGDGNDVELEFLGKGTLVSNTNDAGFGSLRQAVADANASSGHDLIAFAIDDALLVGGRYLIEAGDGLLVSDMSTIDATTQFDFAGDPLVELRNESVVPSPTGFAFPLDGFLSYDASGSSLRGFSLTGWANGVTVNANDVLIAGNYFGIPLDGSSGGGNEIGIQASSDYTGIVIGGIESRDRNVIANSSVAGIDLFAISGVVIQGNYIGTDPTGMSNLPNQRGIRIQRSIVGLADDNRIGSLATGAGNLISGNTIAGVEIDGGFAGIENNQVIGNWIGVDATGNAALPNGVGVLLINSTFATTVASNVISGNNTHGILITDGAVGNTIAGNILGLNADGTTAVPNLNHGISIENGSANNVIGGLDTDSRNIISGNNLFGVSVTSSNDNRILGNYLGLDRTGALQLANGLGAISLNNASFTSIGSNGTELNRNRIVGADASQTGISLENQSNSNAITANHFGLSASDQPLGYLNNVILISDSDENTIGGTTEAERNVLGQYTSHGILITNGSELNVVTGNYVGVHPDGNSPLFTESHQTTGIALINSPNNFIGLATIGAGNLISGNQTGIFIGGTQSTSNEIIGNAIGLNADGNAAIGNEQGILIGDARNTRVGGVAVGQRNIISGNRIGIGIYGDNRDTTISGNWIGTDASGDTQTGMAVGNLESGIVYQGGIRGVIRDNLIVQAGVFGPSPPEPPGAIDVQAGNVVLSRNLIHNNYKKSITTAVSPGAVTITQARLDGIVLGKIEDATPFTTFLVEFFSASEEGQAEVYVGSGAVVTNEDGFAEFEIGGLGDLIPGKFLTATITGTRTEGGDDRNTSPIAQGKVPQVAIIRGLPDFSREGTSISAQAFAIDSTITGYAITGYLWQVLQDNQPYLTGNEASIQFAPEDQGIYRVQLTLTLTDINGTGDQQTVVLGPHLITVSNVAPSPQFEIHPNRPTANQPVTFSSTSSDPGQWDVLTHAWEVRYGSDVVFSQAADPNATEVSFTPTVGGIYFVTLTVDDNDGGPTGARSLQRLFEVAGLPGQAAIIAPTSGSEGQTIRARVPESELQRTEQLDFTWRVEKRDSLASPPVNFDFTIPSEGVIEFVPDDNGIYRVYLTISDSSGSLPETEHDIEVSNASPTVVLRSGTPLAEVGLPITLEAEINDPGFADTHEVAWVVERNGVTVATGNNSSGPYEFTFTPTQSGRAVCTRSSQPPPTMTFRCSQTLAVAAARRSST
ncbi:MAG: PKD domain-containing protein [Pirellula sp.]|nr:PKD domain-containing protein [Pirellula sp.]